jgi:hypothetical protein
MKELHPDDVALVERAKTIRLERKKQPPTSYRALFRTYGEQWGLNNAGSIERFEKSPTYAVICHWLDQRVARTAEAEAERIVATGRLEICQLTPEVVAYLRACLQRRPDNHDEWLDDEKAMWAVQLIAKTTGLSEAPPQQRARTQIAIGEIHVEIKNLRASDEYAARVARVVEAEAYPALEPPHAYEGAAQSAA